MKKFRKGRTVYRCRKCGDLFQLKETKVKAVMVKCKKCGSLNIEISVLDYQPFFGCLNEKRTKEGFNEVSHCRRTCRNQRV